LQGLGEDWPCSAYYKQIYAVSSIYQVNKSPKLEIPDSKIQTEVLEFVG